MVAASRIALSVPTAAFPTAAPKIASPAVDAVRGPTAISVPPWWTNGSDAAAISATGRMTSARRPMTAPGIRAASATAVSRSAQPGEHAATSRRSPRRA